MGQPSTLASAEPRCDDFWTRNRLDLKGQGQVEDMATEFSQSEPEVEKQLRSKLLCYHEAGHAVLMWNLGFEVDRVFVDRARLSGHVLPTLERPESHSVSTRIARILYYLAGGVAHRCFQEGPDKTTMHPSIADIKYVLDIISTLEDLPAGAEIYLLQIMLVRTIQIVDTAEVQAQIHRLASALQPHGCLFKRQVHLLLKGMSVSHRAIQLSRGAVAEIVSELPTLLQNAKVVAPRVAKDPKYQQLAALPSDQCSHLHSDPQAPPE